VRGVKQPPSYDITKRAKEMRRSPTPSEERLWHCLRNRQIENSKFRRQTWLGPFIVDFVCLKQGLVIEADGSQHQDDAGYDHHRSVFLEGEGFQVLRFWNNEILTNIDGVLELIRDRLLAAARPSPSHALRGPLPLPKWERGR
jgi:very-short-patch-repair endonuclease